jgi:tetratricopeptide (TPR) repeat protein
VTQPVGSDDARAVNLGWARSQPVGSDDARAVNLGWAQSQPVTQPVGNDNALAGNPRLLYQRAQELFRLKNYVEAAQYFEKAYSLDNKAQLALNAAGSYREAGIRDRAIEWYKKALLTNPTEAQREEALENFKGFNVSADVYIEVADACRQTGRIKEAISYYVRCHYQLSGNSDPAAYQQVVDKLLSIISDPKILSNIAVDYAEQGDFEQAALFSEQAFALDNQSAQLAFNCARAYENAGQLGRAKHFYTACLDIAPENVAAQEGLQRIEAMPTLPKDNGRGAKNQYEGIGMLRGHGYETENQSKDVNNNQEHWKERVKYLTEQERQQHKVSVRGGKLYQGNKELDTRNADAMAKGTVSGRMIFVMSTSGAIYAADMVGEMKKSGALIYELIESERKAWNLGRQIYYHRLQKSEVEKFHHSSLLAGEEVAGAGELQVGVENSAGTLEVVSDASGHYRPAPHITQNVLQEFNRKGVDLTSVRVQILARGGSEIPARDFLSENKQNLKNEGTGLAYQQAIADYEKGEYLSAAGLFQRAFEFTNSSEFELAYSVGISYFKASEWKQAKLYFEKCLRLNPNTDIRSQAQRYLNSPELNSGLRNI